MRAWLDRLPRWLRFALVLLAAGVFTWHFPILFELALAAIIGGAFWAFT